MAKAVAKSNPKTNAVSEKVPDFLKDYSGEGTENTSDLVVVPRIKLLQALSPEVSEGDEKAGNYWHTIAEESLGAEIRMTPLFISKSVVLWRPRKSGGGILARADDAIHWDRPNQEFEVKLDSGKTVTWNTGASVQASGLQQFGSSDPEDENSKPAATLNINIVSWFPDFPEYSPAIVSLSKASLPVGKKFVSKLGISRLPSWGRVFMMSSTKNDHASGTFHDYKFEAVGVIDQDDAAEMREMYQYFRTKGVAIKDAEDMQNDEEDTVKEDKF
tara:strand:- start:2456 stop:3274 length:819 start_codon:yes stop_codon:yes gene_type:complete